MPFGDNSRSSVPIQSEFLPAFHLWVQSQRLALCQTSICRILLFMGCRVVLSCVVQVFFFDRNDTDVAIKTKFKPCVLARVGTICDALNFYCKPVGDTLHRQHHCTHKVL